MNVLGIHDGHTATACLIKNGVVEAMISEERLNRIKNYSGMPELAAKWVLESTKTDPAAIDAVALVGLVKPNMNENSLLMQATQLLPYQIWSSEFVTSAYVSVMSSRRGVDEIAGALRSIGVRAPIKKVEHHLTHAAGSYFLSPLFDRTGRRNEKVLIITLDGSGDGLCGTVSIASGRKIERVLSIPSYHSIGEMYSGVTRFLGMKQWEHEYKVMGLAPYAPDDLADKACRYFRNYLQISESGLSFVNRTGKFMPGFIRKLQEELRFIRFDAVAAGIQTCIEEVIPTFVRNWIAKTGIRKVVFGGGVFMNVKLNMLLSQMPEIDEMFFMPSGGDESTAVGAAVYAAVELGEETIMPLEALYMGPSYSPLEIAAALENYRDKVEWDIIDPDKAEKHTAGLLLKGNVIGRLAGRMEWGARSLGNRSLLADGRDLAVVRKLNAAIKMRDFWMPFAPSIMWERRHDYLINPRDMDAPFMTLAFASTPLAHQHLRAGLHQYDLTCRPQLVRKETNPGYHRLLEEWERLSGCGGLLNTSFNLHGEPIVCSPEDAIKTLLSSEIDDLMLENYWVRKR